MMLPTDLSKLVEKLAIASKTVKHLEGEAAKLLAARTEMERLKAELVLVLDRAGFTEDAVELLLAAR